MVKAKVGQLKNTTNIHIVYSNIDVGYGINLREHATLKDTWQTLMKDCLNPTRNALVAQYGKLFVHSPNSGILLVFNVLYSCFTQK